MLNFSRADGHGTSVTKIPKVSSPQHLRKKGFRKFVLECVFQRMQVASLLVVQYCKWERGRREWYDLDVNDFIILNACRTAHSYGSFPIILTSHSMRRNEFRQLNPCAAVISEMFSLRFVCKC